MAPVTSMLDHFQNPTLVNTLRIVASPGDVQRQLYPSFVVVGDEIASDFDSAFRTLLGKDLPASLISLNGYIDDLSGGNPDFWGNLDDQRWNRCRELAQLALIEIGSSYEVPAKNGAMYSSGDEIVDNSGGLTYR